MYAATLRVGLQPTIPYGTLRQAATVVCHGLVWFLNNNSLNLKKGPREDRRVKSSLIRFQRKTFIHSTVCFESNLEKILKIF